MELTITLALPVISQCPRAHSMTVLLRRAIQLSFGKVTRCLTVAEFGGNATLPRNLAPNITSWYASGCAEPLFQAQAPWRILNDSQLVEPACVKPFPFIQNSTHLVLDPGTYLLTETQHIVADSFLLEGGGSIVICSDNAYLEFLGNATIESLSFHNCTNRALLVRESLVASRCNFVNCSVTLATCNSSSSFVAADGYCGGGALTAKTALLIDCEFRSCSGTTHILTLNSKHTWWRSLCAYNLDSALSVYELHSLCVCLWWCDLYL